MNPFIKKETIHPTFFQAVFKRQPKFNAVIEINNLLASRSILEISREEIMDISSKYEINFKTTYRDCIQDFYAFYLSYCFEDKKFTDFEIKTLQHLGKLLDLNADEIVEMNHQVGLKIYSEETEKALKDGRITNEEKRFLKQLKSTFNLPEDITDSIYTTVASNLLNEYIEVISSDQRISKEEETELIEMANSLGIELNFDDKARATFDNMKLLWNIENGSTPEIKVALPLSTHEVCYFKAWCNYAKTPGKHSSFHTNSRYMEGLMPEDNIEMIDKGNLFLTNKRLIFVGENRSTTIYFNKITNYYSYINGVELFVNGEDKIFLLFYENVDVFAALLRNTAKIQSIY